MEKRNKIYRWEVNLEEVLGKVKESNIKPNTKQRLLEFAELMIARDLNKRTIASVIRNLRIALELLDIEAKDCSEKDIITLFSRLKTKTFTRTMKIKLKESVKIVTSKPKTFSEETLIGYKRNLKGFFKYLGKVGIFENLKINGHKKKNINYSDIITEEEVSVALDNIKILRNKAILITLHELGARADEFLNLRIKDIIREKNWVKIRLYGKTGERIVPIVSSIPYLFQYLNQHPDKNNSNAWLWLKLGNNDPLRYDALCRVLKKTLGKDKKSNPHWFRHSRATINASWMTESQLCQFMGWVIGSPVVRRYVHTNTNQLTDTILTHHGLKKKEDNIPSTSPRVCSVCNSFNEPKNSFCKDCGTVLSLKVAIESENKFNEQLNITIQKMMDLMKDKGKWQRFEEFCNNNNERV